MRSPASVAFATGSAGFASPAGQPKPNHTQVPSFRVDSTKLPSADSDHRYGQLLTKDPVLGQGWHLKTGLNHANPGGFLLARGMHSVGLRMADEGREPRGDLTRTHPDTSHSFSWQGGVLNSHIATAPHMTSL